VNDANCEAVSVKSCEDTIEANVGSEASDRLDQGSERVPERLVD
jgi:hypothetical protein